ncbi:histone-lysine N-methyltransferase 2C isoform X8 [Lampetra planeri]
MSSLSSVASARAGGLGWDWLSWLCAVCRWVHASCENLLLEDAVEEAADQGFDCSTCRPFVTVPQVPASSDEESQENEPVTPIVPCIKIKEPEPPKVYSRDGVYLTETGLTQLQSLLVPPVPRKQRRPKLRLKLPGQPDLVTELQSPIELHPQSNPLEQEPLPDDIKEAETMECDNKSETFTSPERETQEDSAVPCSKEVDSIKKRKRNPYRPGIGGFMVRHRGRGGAMRGRGVSRRGTGGARSDSLTSPIASDIGRSDDVTSEHLPETPMDEITATPEPIEKQKQRRWRKKKSALEDAFPTYLQEAFFGKGLLDTSKEKRSSLDLFSDEESAQPSEGAQQKPTPPAQSETPEVVARDEAGPTDDGTPVQAERLREPCPTSAPISAGTATDQGKAQVPRAAEDPLAALSEVLSSDEILGILSGGLRKSSETTAGLDLGSIPDEQSSSAQGPAAAAAAAATQRGQQLRPEPLDSLLGTSDLDRIVTDELAKIEAKDVADLFSAISPAGGSQPQPPVQNTHGILGAARNLTALSQFPAPGRSEPSPMMPQASFPEFSGCREKVSSFSPSSNPASPWSAAGAPPAVAGEGEGDGLSYNQRNILKWEKDELLGEMATTSPVLYANINFPNLKTEYPDWPTRAKQIAKLWRKASASEKAPFLQKARDNRAAVRISKAQRAGETLLRKPLELAEPVGGAQSEQHAKEQQRLREVEQEQDWRQRQQLRLQSKQQAKLEATQRLEMAKQEQLLQQQRHPQGGQTDSQETSPARGGKLEINMSSPPHGGQEGSQQQSIGSQMRGDEQSSAGGKVEPQVITAKSGSWGKVLPDGMFEGHAGAARQIGDQGKYQLETQTSSGQAGSVTDGQHQERIPAAEKNGMLGLATSLSETSADGRVTPQLKHMSPSPNMFVRPQTPGTPTSFSQGDVFVKPQAPGPSRLSTQGSQSPAQSPVNSRPNSPFDTYSKMPGTPRPSSHSDMPAELCPNSPDPFLRPRPPSSTSMEPCSSGNIGVMRQRHVSADDPYSRMPGTPRPMHATDDPYSRMPGTPRPMHAGDDPYNRVPVPSRPWPGSDNAYGRMPGTPRPHSSSEVYGKPTVNTAADPYARQPLTPRPNSLQMKILPGQGVSPSAIGPSNHEANQVFKAPLPPHMSPSTPSSPRASSHDRPSMPQRTVEQSMQMPPSPTRQMAGDPYAQQPHTPRPMMIDPYSQPPLTPRPPNNESFAHPQQVSQSSSYSHHQSTYRSSHGELYPQQRLPPGQKSGESQQPTMSSPNDPYSHQPATTRPVQIDPYLQSSSTPQVSSAAQYSQHQNSTNPPVYSGYNIPPCSPRHPLIDQSMGSPQPPQASNLAPMQCMQPLQGPRMMVMARFPNPASKPGPEMPHHKDPSLQPAVSAGQGVQQNIGCQSPQTSGSATLQGETFGQASLGPRQMSAESIGQPKPLGSGGMGDHQALSTSMQPQGLGSSHAVPSIPTSQFGPQPLAVLQPKESPGGAASTEQQSMAAAPHDAELEKQKQRQKLRELLIRQQQQRKALHQEKALQEQMVVEGGSIPLRHWPQDDGAHQHEPPHNKPPPPYPSQTPFGGQRNFSELAVGRFQSPGLSGTPPSSLSEVHFRPQVPGEFQGLEFRNAGPRFQLHQRMHVPENYPGQPPHMRAASSPQYNNPGSFPQQFQVHSIPPHGHPPNSPQFIELRHNAPIYRIRPPFSAIPQQHRAMIDSRQQMQSRPQGTQYAHAYRPPMNPHIPLSEPTVSASQGLTVGAELSNPALPLQHGSQQHPTSTMPQQIVQMMQQRHFTPQQAQNLIQQQQQQTFNQRLQQQNPLLPEQHPSNPTMPQQQQQSVPLMRQQSANIMSEQQSQNAAMVQPQSTETQQTDECTQQEILTKAAPEKGVAPTSQQPEAVPTSGSVVEQHTSDVKPGDLGDKELDDLAAVKALGDEDDDLENLTLDPIDGKGGESDLDTHLDDLLMKGGEFDLLAYTDPELGMTDKRDMFNEQLGLGDSVEEKGGDSGNGAMSLDDKECVELVEKACSSSSLLPDSVSSVVKEEIVPTCKDECKESDPKLNSKESDSSVVTSCTNKNETQSTVSAVSSSDPLEQTAKSVNVLSKNKQDETVNTKQESSCGNNSPENTAMPVVSAALDQTNISTIAYRQSQGSTRYNTPPQQISELDKVHIVNKSNQISTVSKPLNSSPTSSCVGIRQPVNNQHDMGSSQIPVGSPANVHHMTLSSKPYQHMNIAPMSCTSNSHQIPVGSPVSMALGSPAHGQQKTMGSPVPGQHLPSGSPASGQHLPMGSPAPGQHITMGSPATGQHMTGGSPVSNQHLPMGSPAHGQHLPLGSPVHGHHMTMGSPASMTVGSPAGAHLATVGSPAPGQQRLAMNSPHPTVGSPHFTVGSPSSQKQINLQQPGVNTGMIPQANFNPSHSSGMPPAMPPGHQGPFTPSHSLPPPSQMSLQKEKSLLLDEQPLLLQDLVEQEKKEQQRQQMQAMLQQQQQRQQSITGSMFPNIDLDKFTPDDITDPIAKAKMVALKGINKVMTQGAMVVPSIARPRIPVMTQQIMGSSDPPPSSGQQIEVGGSNMMQMARPNPPTFGAVMTDADVGQYREWLLHTQALLQMQQKFLEDQIGAHRKSKKALSAKQRTAKKAGRELAEKDAEQLKNVTEQQSMVQKQLEQLRKQQKEHAELIEEFRTKHQQAHASGASSAGMSGALQGPPNMMPMGPGQQAGMGPLGPGQQPGMRPMMPGQQANMRPMGSIHQQGMSPMGPGSQQGMAGMAAGLQQGMGPMGLGYQQGMRHMPPGLQQSLRHMGPGHQQGMRQMMPGQQQAMMSLGPMGPGQQLSMMLLGQMGPDQQQGMRLIGPGQQQGMGSQGQMGPGQQQGMRLLGPGPQQGMPPMGQMVPGQQQVIRMMGPGQQQQGLGSMVQMGPGQQQGMAQMGPGQQQGMRLMGPGQQQGMRQLISGQQQGMRPMGQMGPGQHLGMNQMMGVSQQGSGQFGPGQQQGMRLMGPAQQPIGAMGQIGPGQQHTMRQMGPGPQQGMGPGSQHNEMGQNLSSVNFQSMGAMGNQHVTGQRQHPSVGGMEPALPSGAEHHSAMEFALKQEHSPIHQGGVGSMGPGQQTSAGSVDARQQLNLVQEHQQAMSGIGRLKNVPSETAGSELQQNIGISEQPFMGHSHQEKQINIKSMGQNIPTVNATGIKPSAGGTFGQGYPQSVRPGFNSRSSPIISGHSPRPGSKTPENVGLGFQSTVTTVAPNVSDTNQADRDLKKLGTSPRAEYELQQFGNTNTSVHQPGAAGTQQNVHFKTSQLQANAQASSSTISESCVPRANLEMNKDNGGQSMAENKACAAGTQSPVSEVLSKPQYTDVADCQKGEKSNSLPNVIPTLTHAINPASSNKQQGFSGSSQSRNMFLQSHPGVQAVPSGQGKNDGHVTPDPVHTPGTGGHMADSPSRVSSDGATNPGSTNQEQADESKPIGMMVSGTENMKTEASASEESRSASGTNFDNNPFSDTFQDRERRERLRLQQEQQRIQLMQEVERHRAMQNYEVEFQKQPNIVSNAQSEVADGPLRHQAMLSAIQVQSNQPTIHLERAQQQQHQQRFMGPGHLAHGQMSRQQQHLMMGVRPVHGNTSVDGNQSQMAKCFGPETLDQESRLQQPPVPQSPVLAQPPGFVSPTHSGSVNFPQGPEIVHPGQGGIYPYRPGFPGNGAMFQQHVGPSGPRGPHQRLPFNPGMAFPGQPPRQPGLNQPQLGQEVGTMPLPPNYPGASTSLIQLYSNIIPEEKGKKKRMRKKKKEDEASCTPMSPGTPGSNPSIPSTPTTPSTPFANELGHGPHPGTPMVLQSPGSSGIGPHQMVPHSPGSHYSHSLGRPMPAGITRMVHEPFSAQDGMHHLQLKPEQMELGSCGGAQRPMGMMTGAAGMSLTQFGAVRAHHLGGGPHHNLADSGHMVSGPLAPPHSPIRSMSTVDSSMAETKSESGNELLKKLLQARHVRLQNVHAQYQLPMAGEVPAASEGGGLLPQQLPVDRKEEGKPSMAVGMPPARHHVQPRKLDVDHKPDSMILGKLEPSVASSQPVGSANYPPQMGCAHEGMERKREGKGNAEWRRDGREDVDTEPDPSCPEQRMRKVPKGVGKGATRKKRKKEDEEKWKPYTSTDALMSQLKQQLALLPLIEPTIKVNLGLFPPHGSNRLNGDSQLKGSFGSAVLDGVPDYYTELIFKQTNLSNPPTPPASLPPTPPPPGTRQKLLNGFATAEELTGKCLELRRPPQAFPFPYVDGFGQMTPQGPRAVDVPASLPTPPHNGQEDVSRPQEALGERESPDSIIFTSSPESVTGTEPPRFPVMDERPDTSASPVIPLLPSAGTALGRSVRGGTLTSAQPQPYNGNDHVSVTLTLSTNAADDINIVVSAVAHLLRVAVPNSYEYSDCPVQRLPTHPLLGTMHPGQHTEHAAPGRMVGGKPAGMQAQLHKLQQQRQQAQQQHAQQQHVQHQQAQQQQAQQAQHGQQQARRQWCRHCDVVVLGSGVRVRAADLPFSVKGSTSVFETSNQEIVFCSSNCYSQYAAALQASLSQAKESPRVRIGDPVTDEKDRLRAAPQTFGPHTPGRGSNARHPPGPTQQPVTQPGTAPASQQPPDGAQAPPGQPPQPYQRGEMCLDVRTLPKYPEPDRKPGLHVPVQVAAPDSQPPAPLDGGVKLEMKEAEGLAAASTVSAPRSNVHSKIHKSRAPRAVHAADMPEEPRLACSPARPPMSSPPRAPPRPIVVQPPACKKWKGVRWKKWRLQVTVLSHSGVLRPPSEDEIEELMRKLGTSLRPEPAPPDMRSCSFCHLQGDGATDGPARLLNLDLDIWVHLNCALWSSEVYETQAGALINVEGARRRGLGTKCGACLRMGATTSCNRPRCPNVYHFACALRMRCMFFKDKTVLCPAHRPRSSTGQELGCFAVLRRVYVQRDEVRQLASLVRRGPMGGGTFRVGSLLFHALGQILPGQASSPYFHSRTALYPIGYQATRLYWSTRYTNKRCRYLCSVSEAEGRPRFTVRIVEQGHEDLVHAASTPQGVWDKILEPVVRLRKGAEMLRLFPDYLRGEEMFGLTVQAVLRITESLPGVECCQNYMFRYGRHPLMELPLAVNPSGCARTEPRLRSHFKRPHTLNSSSNSKSFQSTMSGELSAPYSKQFVYSKSSQYRRMKTEWKINVYLARSRIQGLGLYASRDIEKHTMVIEYIGEIIRNEVANRHEKLYESTNRGVYMFRLDSEHVIDATITGGPARYINHSCAPNCVAELVTFDRENKIIISSCRRIQKGEELTYDYLFDFEDDQNKIPCHCGAINCRKWMN